MKPFFNVVGMATLAVMLAFPLAYVFGLVELPTCKLVMFVATIVWFTSALVNLFGNDDSAGAVTHVPAVPQDAENG